MTYLELIKLNTKKAEDLNLESTAVKILIQELSGYENSEFIIHLSEELSLDKLNFLQTKIDLYLNHKIPIQYILGYSYFYQRKFMVNSNVLIPRQETEELVSILITMYHKIFLDEQINLVDIGTGSGSIAVTMKKECPNINVFATDISHEAILQAKTNANLHQANITFLQGNMLEPLLDNHLKFDIIVSNPPYIDKNEFVDEIVKNNEPHLALYAKNNGMEFYEIILKNAHVVLNKQNIIAFEHGVNQKEAMIELIKKYYPNSEYQILKDLNGKDRMTLIINR